MKNIYYATADPYKRDSYSVKDPKLVDYLGPEEYIGDHRVRFIRKQWYYEKLEGGIPSILHGMTLKHDKLKKYPPLDILDVNDFFFHCRVFSEKAYEIIKKYTPKGYLMFPINLEYRNETLPYYALYFEFDATQHIDLSIINYDITTSIPNKKIVTYDEIFSINRNTETKDYLVVRHKRGEPFYLKSEINHSIFMFKHFKRILCVNEELKNELEAKCYGFRFVNVETIYT